MIPFATGLHRLAAGYDALLCDVWGVLHDGVRAHPEAAEALSRYRDGGGRVVLISNAPRSGARLSGFLHDYGIGRHLYDDVVTSGDVTARILASGAYGRRCFYLGPERDKDLMEGSEMEAVEEASEADVILCVGLRDDAREQTEDYRALLRSLAERGLTMVCANPDQVVERGGVLVHCAGSLAALYEELGGECLYFGKPRQEIYRLAWEAVERVLGRAADKERVLAIGDGVATDMRGAADFGVDALFVTGGLAWRAFGDDPLRPQAEAVARFCAERNVRPIAALPRLRWEA